MVGREDRTDEPGTRIGKVFLLVGALLGAVAGVLAFIAKSWELGILAGIVVILSGVVFGVSWLGRR
jgi:cobalamin synthase